LFPLSPISNFETRGLKYAPDVLGGPYQFGWNGACNEMISTEALISFDEGTILITHSNKGE
jgi:thiamine pyrophosphokinase